MVGLTLIRPEWSAPSTVRAVATGREGGFSSGGWRSLNLGDHVADRPDDVERNRERLRAELALPVEPLWLQQVHGTAVVEARPGLIRPMADAAVAGPDSPGAVLAILTADCLPVLFADRAGRYIGAAHAGWRGLTTGVLEATVDALHTLGAPRGELRAWLGPAIGPAAYEVGAEVQQAVVAGSGGHAALKPGRPGHWYLDLYAAARARLAAAGVEEVAGGGLCTYSDPARFYSHRRDGGKLTGPDAGCGRQATLIWRC